MMRRLVQTLVALSFLALAPASAQQFFARQAGPTCSSTLGTVKSFDGITEISMPTTDVLLCSAPVTVEATIVGGGAGGGTGCGGGGAQALYFPALSITIQMPVLVGVGGLGSTGGTASGSGGPSWLGTNYVTGGAGSGVFNGDGPATASGSGSGACGSNTATHTGGTGGGQTNENAGGAITTFASPFPGGGGGGAGSVGGTATLVGKSGVGGTGIGDPITGKRIAGGGGGSCFAAGGVGCVPKSGVDGGGNGVAGNGGAATANTGGGGGAGFNANTGGTGGSGYVSVRFTGAGCVGCILPSSAAITLPINTNLAAFYSVVKLTGRAGSCLQVTRASDSTTMDIGFVGNVCDWTAADTFGANTTITVSKIYDQSGNGLDLTCTSSGAPAVGSPTFSGQNTWFKIRPVSFEGVSNVALQWCQNTSFAVNTNALTVYQVAAPRVSYDLDGFWQFSDAALTTVYASLQTNNTSLTANYPTAHVFTTGLFPRAAPGTMSASFSGSAGAIIRANGTEVTSATNAASNVAAGFKLGSLNAVNGIFDFFTVAVYGAAHTSPQMVSTETAISAPYSLQSSFTNRVVYGGNSLSTGLESTSNQTPAWQNGFGKSTNGPIPSWEPIVMSSAGRTLFAECNILTNYTGLFDPSKTINAVQIADPTNDISVTTYVSSADAISSVTALYNNTTLPCIASLKAAGFEVVTAQTSIARDSWNTTGGVSAATDWKETARTTYNGLLTGGAVANGYIASDRAGAPFGIFNSSAATSDLTYYFAGGTHLSNLGYWIVGGIDKTAICSAGGC